MSATSKKPKAEASSITAKKPKAKASAKIKLTRDRVEAAKPANDRREIRDALAPGLRLIVQPSGRKSWAYRYKFGVLQRKMTLGEYPTVTLEKARAAAATVRGEVHQGGDPAADKAATRAPANSVLAAFKAYDQNHLSWGREYVDHETDDVTPAVTDDDGNIVEPKVSKDTAAATRSFFVRRVLPKWALRNMADITTPDVVALLDPLEAYKDARRKGRTRLSHFFSYSKERNAKIKFNPAAGIAATGSKDREHVLSAEELRAVWLACDQVGTFGAMVRTLILTAARRTEVAEMARAELTETIWSIDGNRTKNGHPVDIYRTASLNAVLKPLLERGDSPFVFEGRHHNRPISGFSDWKDKLDAITGDAVRPWTLHDLRRTATTIMERLKIPMEVRDACTNHVRKGKVQRTYNRHDYAAEKVVAFKALAREVERIVTNKSAKVVPMRRASDG